MITITGVAIRYDGKVHSLSAPARHTALISQFYSQQIRILDEVHEQGFITSEGQFVNRFQAYQIAERAKQLKSPGRRGHLISEQVW